MIPPCDCGFDPAQPTGHPDDVATCQRCTWQVTGIFADHRAYHHYRDTLHEWHLVTGYKSE